MTDMKMSLNSEALSNVKQFYYSFVGDQAGAGLVMSKY